MDIDLDGKNRADLDRKIAFSDNCQRYHSIYDKVLGRDFRGVSRIAEVDILAILMQFIAYWRWEH